MAQKIEYEKYILPIAGAAALFIGGKKLFEFLGLIKSDNKQNQDNTLLPGSPFNPQFWKGVPGAYLLSVGAAQAYAQLIKESAGLFNDDESTIIGVFQNLKTQSQVSWLADQFQSMYGKSLAAFLIDVLSEGEYQTILDIVNRLPAYKP